MLVAAIILEGLAEILRGLLPWRRCRRAKEKGE